MMRNHFTIKYNTGTSVPLLPPEQENKYQLRKRKAIKKPNWQADYSINIEDLFISEIQEPITYKNAINC